MSDSERDPIMSYFAYRHLPPHLQEVSKPIGELAEELNTRLPNSPEKSAGLRKLLEAKDCLVRAALPPFVIIIVLLCCSSLNACERCGLFGQRCALRKAVVVQQQVVAAPYVAPLVYPQVNYFVGAPIRVEAIVAKALQDDPTYAEFQRFRAWRQLGEQSPAQRQEQLGASVPAQAYAALVQHCASCHSGATPKKGLVLDGSAKLSCVQAVRSQQRVLAGTMPPADHPPLSAEAKGDVLQELIELVEDTR